jgi:hypothetical protein
MEIAHPVTAEVRRDTDVEPQVEIGRAVCSSLSFHSPKVFVLKFSEDASKVLGRLKMAGYGT